MITYVTGNIFESNCSVLVNPVNCKGVMGAGLAKQFKIKFPDMFKYYKASCGVELSEAGKTILFEDDMFDYGKSIMCVATKNHWKDSSSLDIVDRCCEVIVFRIHYHELTSIAIPKLGCGLGGLKWDDVKPIMEKWLNGLNCNVEVYV